MFSYMYICSNKISDFYAMAVSHSLVWVACTFKNVTCISAS